MVITAIKTQAKHPGRVSVFVEGAYAFSVSYNQLLEQKLHAGLQLDESRLSELKHASEFGKAYERALLFVMLRPRSQREMQEYARRKKWTPADTRAITAKLTAKGYLNDRAFAKAWVSSRAAAKKVSLRKLSLELKQKGISEAIIKEALGQSGFNERHALQALVAKKRKLARYQDNQRLMRYLAGQGFSFDDIREALNH